MTGRPQAIVVGPSHLIDEFVGRQAWIERFASAGVQRFALPGLPNFSNAARDLLQEASRAAAAARFPTGALVWMVSDWRFANYHVDVIRERGLGLGSGSELWFDAPAKPCNIDEKYFGLQNDVDLVNHQLKVLDHVVEQYPGIRLLFWCLYVRTKVHEASSLPAFAHYDSIRERYLGNAIDLDRYVKRHTERTGADAGALFADAGGHPSSSGYEVICEILAEESESE